METIAGMIEPGERAEDVVRREALEEAGCQLGELVRLYEYHSTPGGASERVTLFVGQTDSEGVGGIHGLEHEGRTSACMCSTPRRPSRAWTAGWWTMP